MTKENNGSQKKQQTIVLVCLSASPSTMHVIDTAAKLASQSKEAIALYVSDTADKIPVESQLYENMQYAEKLGFEVHTARSNDIALTISEYAKRMNVTDLFIGYSVPNHLLPYKKPVSEQLMNDLPDVDIHIIPDSRASSFAPLEKSGVSLNWNLRDFVYVVVIMSLATLLSAWFYASRFSNANIITIYILGVLITSLLTSHQFYGILAAVLYILLFNFLFIDPRYSLLVYDSEYLVTYLVSVVAALITGSLTSRMKDIARSSAENAYQAKVLLDTSNQLEGATGTDEIIRITCMQLVHLLNRTVLFYYNETPLQAPAIYAAEGKSVDQNQFRKETDAVLWTLEHRHHAGAYTSHFDHYRCRYLSIHSGENCYGVIGIDMEKGPFTEFENTVLLSILNEFTLALDNSRMAMERQKAEIAAENERLRAGLLRSISHDLRTPLTSIYGNALTLAQNEEVLNKEDKDKIYSDLMEDSAWLTNQMENILAMTKLENTHYLNLSIENVDDVIAESVRLIHSDADHPIAVEDDGETYFAMMDAKMILQVMTNLLSNAVKYTPPGTQITVERKQAGDQIFISVKDTGEGISQKDKEHIFELFYTGSHATEDNTRSMGIGLNLCEMIVNAHGGRIEVYDNKPKGTVFRFSLPAKEVSLDE